MLNTHAHSEGLCERGGASDGGAGRADFNRPAPCDVTGAVRLLIGRLAHAAAIKAGEEVGDLTEWRLPRSGLIAAGWVGGRGAGIGGTEIWGGGHPSCELGLSFQR